MMEALACHPLGKKYPESQRSCTHKTRYDQGPNAAVKKG
jgi:hypothetical protein